MSGDAFNVNLTADSELLEEDILWSAFIQVLSGLKCIHDAGLAYRSLSLERVLITRDSRKWIYLTIPFECF